MKKYLQESGYHFKKAYNDLTDKQFTLTGVVYADGEAKTLNNMILDRVEVYTLFLKDFDAELFGAKIETALASAISDGVNVSDGTAIEVENVENGYDITLTFNIRS